MNVTLIGYKKIDFINKEGQQVIGTKVHLALPMPETPNSAGSEAESFFLPSSVQLPELTPGANYTAGFDNRGKLISLTAIKTFPARA